MAARGKCASRVVAGCIILLFLATTAHGDGTGRKPTPAEQEFYRSTQDALAAALPADVPEGWEITDQAESDELEVVGIETGTRPMEVTYYLQWTNVALQEQGEEKAADQISAITGPLKHLIRMWPCICLPIVCPSRLSRVRCGPSWPVTLPFEQKGITPHRANGMRRRPRCSWGRDGLPRRVMLPIRFLLSQKRRIPVCRLWLL